MYKPPTYPAELIEAGREVPSLFRSLPHDETLTEAVIKAGFTHCFGVPYNAPPDRNAVSMSEAKKDIRIWPAPRKRGRPRK